MWLWRYTVIAATLFTLAFSMAMPMARSITTKPKLQFPLMRAVAADSFSTSNGAPGSGSAAVVGYRGDSANAITARIAVMSTSARFALGAASSPLSAILICASSKRCWASTSPVICGSGNFSG